MEYWLIPTIILALLLGALAGWWAARTKQSAAMAELRQDVAERDATLAEQRTAVAEAQAKASDAAARVARAEAQREAAVERATEIARDRETLKAQFKALSAEQLRQQERTTAERLVAPVSEGLRQLDERLRDVEKERTRMSAELREQIAQIQSSGELLRKETMSLSSALRTPQVRGAWGEQSLRRMVEISGLTERVDFDEQASATASDGNRQRPDMTIRLAGDKVVFVDSKVPLAAVLEAYNTEDEAAQAKHLARFARHVKQHIDDLAGKQYWDLDAGSPEFVVLFLPSDEFYRLAQEQIPDLHDYAARKNVMLASPGILIPMLHIVAHGWTQASLAESAAEVVKLGRELHERLATMGGHFSKLGRSLNSAVGDYNRAISSLERRVMVSARRFTDLGVTQKVLDELENVDSSTHQPAVAEMIEYEQRALDGTSDE